MRASPTAASTILVAAIAVAAPGSLSAQASRTNPGAIAGTVVDAQTGTAITAARARLLELHREELTHEDGTFSFDGLRPGTYSLAVQRLGYRMDTRRVDIRAGDTIRLRVAMIAAAVQLAPSVVTGTIGERPGQEVLSPASILSGAELDRQLDGTVAASLQSQPGVAVTSIGPATARPVIRGLGGDRILVLEDGQRPGDMSSTSGDHAVAVDPLTARQVEVVRGPMSLLYGSSALGGVVNVVREELPTSLPEHAHGVLTAHGTSVNRGASVGGYVVNRLGPFAVRAEASGRRGENVRTPSGSLINTGMRSYSVSGGAALVGDWGHSGAAYRYYSNDYGIPGGFVGGHANGVDVEMRRHNVRGEAELHLRGSPFSTLHLSGSFTDYWHTELEASGAVGTRFDQQMVAGDLVARHGAFGPLALGAVGTRVQLRDIQTGGSLRTPSTDDYTIAGFVVEEIGRGALRVQAGSRYDRARYTPRERAFIDVGGQRVPVRPRTFGSISGSVGVLYEVLGGVRVGASLSRAYRTPDFNELYSNGPHLAANSFDVGDPNLDAETGVGVDAFVRVTRGSLSGEVAAFRNQLDNYIFPSSRGRAELGTQGGRPRFQHSNEDARFTGAEGRIEWSVTPSVVIDGTASYVRARFTSERDSIPLITATDTSFIAASRFPPFIPPLNGQLGARYERPRWFAGGSVRLAARQKRLGDFETATAGYAIASVTAGVRLISGTRLHTITLRVDNATDREYRDHLSRIKEIMPEPGRNLSLLYRLTF